MKIRNGFVSNSSSSSFMIWNKESKVPEDYNKGLVSPIIAPNDSTSIALPTKLGAYEFGWDFIKYTDLYSKLNWCAIQIMELRDWSDTYYQRRRNFNQAVKDVLGVDVLYDYNAYCPYSTSDWRAYVDHQSSVRECEEFAEFFDNVDDIKRFLFNEDSYIQGGSDND